jgi:Tfp pilus assembly protein PilE
VIELVLVLVIVALIAAIVYPRVIRRAGSDAAGAAAGGAAAPQLRWTAPPGTAAPGSSVPLAVRVENPDGTVRPGVVIEFQTEPTAAGTITPTATSDAAGVARATWSAGPDSGRVVITARVRGEPSAQAQTTVAIGRLAADSATP